MDERVFAGKYRAMRELGTGPAGRTYLASAPDGAEVVVKVVRPADELAEQAIEREVSIVAGIKSDVLPAIREWGHDGEDFFVVRDFVPGADLVTEVEAQKHLASAAVARYGATVAGALQLIHERGAVHGNVKTANLIRTPEDEIKLVGSGLGARAVKPADLAGVPASTASYLAPEQVEGAGITPQTDVYALGVVMYELLAGHVPFTGADAAAVADQQVHVVPPSIVESSPDVLQALEAVVMRALEKAPEERYATAAEMQADIERVMAPPVAVPPQPPKRANPWPWLWLIAALVVLAGLGIAWAIGVFGSNHVPVPNVVGQTLTDAKSAVQAAGLTVGQVTYSGSSVTGVGDGSVAREAPSSGTKVDKASAVDLVVAGRESAAVPNVVGMSQSQASDALTRAGYALGAVTMSVTSAAESGTVLAQTPEAGAQAPKGSTVDLRIAQAPAGPSPVPSTVGMSQADAISTLTAAGFKVSVVARSSGTVSSGTVISQNPVAGVTASPGSVVTIDVSRGPALSTVPDVVGKTQADAVNALTAAGFKSRITFQTGGGTVGDVLDQSPAAAARATPGSTVVITVVQ